MNEALQEVNDKIQAALSLMTTEEADKIIGEPGDEYGVIMQGVQAQMALYFAMMKKHGLRDSKETNKRMGQTIIILAQMVHFAYALGVKRGCLIGDKHGGTTPYGLS